MRWVTVPRVSALAALIAATGLWWGPALKDWQTPKGAVLDIAFAGTRDFSLQVAVTNSGSRPGAVQVLQYTYGDDKDLAGWPLKLLNDQFAIEPGKTVVFSGALPLEMAIPYPEPNVKQCGIDAFLTGADSAVFAKRIRFECFFMVRALNAAHAAGMPTRTPGSAEATPK